MDVSVSDVSPKKHSGRAEPWKPGQSGNPKGRPKRIDTVIELAIAAKIHAAEAIATIYAIMVDEKAKRIERLTAAGILLDRAYGKATQPHDIKADGTITVQIVKQFGDGQTEVTDITPRSKQIEHEE